MTEPSYPVTERNRVRRAHQRGSVEKAAVYAIVDAAMLGHVAYVIDGQPFATPTLIWREGDTLLWHGSAASRMLKSARNGLDACVTVSHLDGLVLARSGMHHSVNYRSAMCYGTARLITDPQEKTRALDGLIDRFYPGRNRTLRPINAQELKATSIVTMPIEDASAKVRAAGVADDEEDYGHPVWAGVIPVKTVFGAAEPCPRLLPGQAIGPDLAPFAEGRRFDDVMRQTQAQYEMEFA
ncbi:MAG: pyridoxamine 5'-phosphate oxidase family protein [Acuticoccus sp.]